MKYLNGVVCGLHRSGTTIVGEIVKQAAEVEVVAEPFNFRFGLKGVPAWYPYLGQAENTNTVTDSESQIEKLLDSAVHLNAVWGKNGAGKSGIKKAVYQFTGGRKQLPWIKLKVKKILGVLPDKVIWKDPFCTFMIPRLLELNVPVVCMLKHPCAFYHSVERQDWMFELNAFDVDGRLRDFLNVQVDEELWATRDQVVALSLLWKLMMKLIWNYRDHPLLLIVKHEDFCIDASATVERVYSHLGIEFTESIKDFVKSKTSASKVLPEIGNIHVFERDSKTLADIWKEKVEKPTQKQILDLLSAEMALYEEI